MSMNVIEASGLGKRYGGTWALRDCSLAIPAGHVAALVGPNGAGKTTLLNLAVGLAAPSAGGVTVLDLLGVAFAAWTLAAFAIGVLAGMLIRRAVPAIAATLAAYAALAFATGLWLREHYITPLVTSSPNPPGSAWAISGWYTKGGTFAF